MKINNVIIISTKTSQQQHNCLLIFFCSKNWLTTYFITKYQRRTIQISVQRYTFSLFRGFLFAILVQHNWKISQPNSIHKIGKWFSFHQIEIIHQHHLNANVQVETLKHFQHFFSMWKCNVGQQMFGIFNKNENFTLIRRWTKFNCYKLVFCFVSPLFWIPTLFGKLHAFSR